MRDYKFRGRRIDNSEWVYGYYSAYVEQGDNGGVEHLYRETATVLHYISDIEGNLYIVYPETVGQYTGLKDENSKEIYEGDIIQDVQHKLFIVFWDDKECVFKLDHKYYHHRDGDECHTHLPMHSKEGEIIGNIHDNSDLLQK